MRSRRDRSELSRTPKPTKRSELRLANAAGPRKSIHHEHAGHAVNRDLLADTAGGRSLGAYESNCLGIEFGRIPRYATGIALIAGVHRWTMQGDRASGLIQLDAARPIDDAAGTGRSRDLADK